MSVPNRFEVVREVAERSSNWERCMGGNAHACHLFTQEVAEELHREDPRWGLVTKPDGQWGCSLIACGSNIGQPKWAEDVVAFRVGEGPERNSWLGVDIIIGAGAPGAVVAWQELDPATNRPDNLWVPPPGLVPPPPPLDPPPPPLPPDDIAEALSRLTGMVVQLQGEVAHLRAELQASNLRREELAAHFEEVGRSVRRLEYQGSLLGFAVRLRPHDPGA